MNNQPNQFDDASEKNSTGSSKRKIVLICVLVALAVLVAVILFLHFREKPVENVPTDPTVTEPTGTEAVTDPTEPPKVMLDNMAALYAQNPDIVGWIRIDGTKLDYPVMYTPDNEEKYFRADFEGNFTFTGLPILDKDCSLDPESDNLIIYGHNMKNGTAFTTLTRYSKESFWEEHPTIFFSTLYEERTYEVLAAFYDRVYLKTDDCFKFYQFIDAEDEAAFNEAYDYYKSKSVYDTGVTAEYGDNLLTLVTCAYHTEKGRFVVIARQVTEELEATE